MVAVTIVVLICITRLLVMGGEIVIRGGALLSIKQNMWVYCVCNITLHTHGIRTVETEAMIPTAGAAQDLALDGKDAFPS